MSVMSVVPADDPMRGAWERYKTTLEFANARKWALDERHVEGSLWAAFVEGYVAGERRAAETRAAGTVERHGRDPGDML